MTLRLHSLFYLTAPLVLFCLGYLKWYVAVVVLIALGFALLAVERENCKDNLIGHCTIGQMMGISILSLFICFVSGIGGYWSQSYDWIVKNPLLNDLTLSPWPLMIDFAEADADIQSLCGDGKVGFVYYLFYYLPAAWVGNLFGSTSVSRLALFLWSAYGLVLVLCWFLRWLSPEGTINRRKSLFALLLFVCWGGMDIVGMCFKVLYFGREIPSLSSLPLLDSWSLPFFMYHSSLASLYWCFNQCIPLWLITMMIFNCCEHRFVLFLYSFTILYSPWGAMGLLPIVVALCLNEMKQRGWAEIKSLLNFANVGFPLILLVVVGSYYASNKTPIAEKGFIWQFWELGEWIGVYVVFILVEIGAYVWMMREEVKHNLLLVTTIGTLSIIPLYKMNYANDFVLRASIPALIILFVIWTKWCIVHYHQQKWTIFSFCLICSLGSLHLIGFNAFRTIHQGRPETYYENERFTSADNAKLAILGESQFFAHNYENTFFWKYLAK